MNAYNAYRETQTQTADPGELVVMLYKGAARFLASAKVMALLTVLAVTDRVTQGGRRLPIAASYLIGSVVLLMTV